MKKEMHEISVDSENGIIYIEGRAPGDSDENYSRVSFHPEQADALCKWIQEEKAKALES